MKKRILTGLIISLLLSCSTYRKISEDKYTINEKLKFQVTSVDKSHFINDDSHSGYAFAKEGYDFVVIYLTVFNNTRSELKVNFDEFYILDDVTGTKYEIRKLEMNLYLLKNHYKIKPNKSKDAVLEFIIKKEVTVDYLFVDGKKIKINYLN